ncbi:hypothetical protein AAHE18_03G322700 [Arachis hypogaea]
MIASLMAVASAMMLELVLIFAVVPPLRLPLQSLITTATVPVLVSLENAASVFSLSQFGGGALQITVDSGFWIRLCILENFSISCFPNGPHSDANPAPGLSSFCFAPLIALSKHLL